MIVDKRTKRPVGFEQGLGWYYLDTGKLDSHIKPFEHTAISVVVKSSTKKPKVRKTTLTLMIQKRVTAKERTQFIRKLEKEGWCVNVESEE